MSLNGQELEIFRAGDHAVPGKRAFTPAELQQIAADYATDGHEAPVVIGHPKLESPAWGWIKSVRAAGSSLFATPHQVVPAFDAAYPQFKKRSAAFDRLPNGKWQLRHVGFLGGTPPVVKGLADAHFASEQYEEGLEFSTEGDGMADQHQQVDKKTIMDSVREVFADVFGGNKGDVRDGKSVDIDALKRELKAEFASEIKTVTEKLATTETAFADYKSTHEKVAKSATASASIAKLKTDGKWLPAFDKMGVPELFASVAEGKTEEFEFADAAGAKHKQTPLVLLEGIFGKLARFVPRGETFADEAAKAEAVAAAASVPEVAKNAASTNVDPASAAFDRDIRALAKTENITYVQAARRLAAQGKSTDSYASATSGAA